MNGRWNGSMMSSVYWCVRDIISPNPADCGFDKKNKHYDFFQRSFISVSSSNMSQMPKEEACEKKVIGFEAEDWEPHAWTLAILDEAIHFKVRHWFYPI